MSREAISAQELTESNGIVRLHLPKSWCKSVRTTKWTLFIWFTYEIFCSLVNINDGFFSCHSNCCQWCLTCLKRSLSYSETTHCAHATPFDLWRKQSRHSFPRFPLIFDHGTVGLPTSTSEDRSGALSSSSGSTTRMHTTSTNWGSVCTAWNRQRDGRVVRMSQGLCAAEGGHFEQLLSRYQ